MADWGRIATDVLTGGSAEVINALTGGSIWGGKGSSGDEIPLKQVPEYPESTAARAKWWEEIQGYSPENMYGAISPDWADIWEDASNKIHQSYWGSPTSSGAVGKVRASAARRNVSDSPALETMIGRLGAAESGDLSSLATEQNRMKAQLGETARGNWLNQLATLSGQQASYYFPQYEESNLDKFIKLLGAGAQVVGAFK